MSLNQEDNLLSAVDRIVELSKTDPKEAEKFARQFIDAELERMANGDPERLIALQQIQWKLDGELRKFKDPVARSNKMQELFWKGVHEFVHELKSI